MTPIIQTCAQSIKLILNNLLSSFYPEYISLKVIEFQLLRYSQVLKCRNGCAKPLFLMFKCTFVTQLWHINKG